MKRRRYVGRTRCRRGRGACDHGRRRPSGWSGVRINERRAANDGGVLASPRPGLAGRDARGRLADEDHARWEARHLQAWDEELRRLLGLHGHRLRRREPPDHRLGTHMSHKGRLHVESGGERAHAARDCRQELLVTGAPVHRCVEEDVRHGSIRHVEPSPQLAACFTSAVIRFSTAGVSSLSAK